jgi:hypothetical protein
MPRSVGDSPCVRNDGGDYGDEADYDRKPCGDCVENFEAAAAENFTSAAAAEEYCGNIECGCSCHFHDADPDPPEHDD